MVEAALVLVATAGAAGMALPVAPPVPPGTVSRPMGNDALEIARERYRDGDPAGTTTVLRPVLEAKGGVQVVEVTVYPPVSVDVVPVRAVIVPPSCPAHAGCVGIPCCPTEIVYASDEPLSVPVRKPFKRTTPLGSRTSTGPETDAPDCVSVHTISDVTVCTAKLPRHVPVRSVVWDGGVPEL